MESVEAFKAYVEKIQSGAAYKNPKAFALGVKRTKNGKVLDAYFPLINWESSFGTAAVISKELNVVAGKNASYNFGMAFQIYDDFCDLKQDREKEKKVSYPILLFTVLLLV